MDYKSLGRTGVQVSPLCLGCMTFGAKTDAEDAQRIVDRAIDAGINFFDTANVYTRGKSEEVVGQCLKNNGKRDRIVLATKAHGRMDDDDPNMWGNSRRHLIAACEASLRRLQTDHIDLYQIHRPQSGIPLDETLGALDSLVQSGKVRYIGTSTFAAWQVVESLWVSSEHGFSRFISEQPPYHLLDRRIERELIPMARSYGIGIIPWSPLAGGFLTGKYVRGQDAPPDTRLQPTHGRASMLANERAFDAVEALTALAREKNCEISQFALAWCMQQPGVTSPIIGPRTLDQLEDNLKALSVELTDDVRKRIDEIVPPGRMVAPFYEADFGPHPNPWY
jgi:aryl-alcohol dehydrogenase-like predicted oxidoreductase